MGIKSITFWNNGQNEKSSVLQNSVVRSLLLVLVSFVEPVSPVFLCPLDLPSDRYYPITASIVTLVQRASLVAIKCPSSNSIFCFWCQFCGTSISSSPLPFRPPFGQVLSHNGVYRITSIASKLVAIKCLLPLLVSLAGTC